MYEKTSYLGKKTISYELWSSYIYDFIVVYGYMVFFIMLTGILGLTDQLNISIDLKITAGNNYG